MPNALIILSLFIMWIPCLGQGPESTLAGKYRYDSDHKSSVGARSSEIIFRADRSFEYCYWDHVVGAGCMQGTWKMNKDTIFLVCRTATNPGASEPRPYENNYVYLVRDRQVCWVEPDVEYKTIECLKKVLTLDEYEKLKGDRLKFAIPDSNYITIDEIETLSGVIVDFCPAYYIDQLGPGVGIIRIELTDSAKTYSVLYVDNNLADSLQKGDNVTLQVAPYRSNKRRRINMAVKSTCVETRGDVFCKLKNAAKR